MEYGNPSEEAINAAKDTVLKSPNKISNIPNPFGVAKKVQKGHALNLKILYREENIDNLLPKLADDPQANKYFPLLIQHSSPQPSKEAISQALEVTKSHSEKTSENKDLFEKNALAVTDRASLPPFNIEYNGKDMYPFANDSQANGEQKTAVEQLNAQRSRQVNNGLSI